MADQKKAPTRKGPARNKSAKTAGSDTAHAAIGAAPKASAPAPAAKPRRAKAASTPAPAETSAVASLFDTQLPKEIRAAVERSEPEPSPATALPLPSPEAVAAPVARLLESGAAQARETYERAHATGDSLRQAVMETAQATTVAALEVNEKVIEALRAQSDVAFDLWRAALTTRSLSDALSLQASGARQVYETAARTWGDVADSARRWLGATVKPLQSTWTGPSR